MHADTLHNLFGLGLLIVGAIAAAQLLRLSRCPGWAIIGGLLAGLILGPTVFGHVKPDLFEDLFVGGADERRELEIRQEVGAAPDILIEHETAWANARWEHQAPMRWGVVVLVGLTLLGAAAGARQSDRGHRDFGAAASIGVWSALVPAGAAFLILHLALDAPPATALLFAAALGIGPWLMTNADLQAADEAEIGGARRVVIAGRIATVLAFLIIGAAAVLDPERRWIWSTTLLVLPVGWLLQGKASPMVRRIVHGGVLPVLAATPMLAVDLVAGFAVWPTLVAIILSADGRGFGAFLGAIIPGGRRHLRTMRLVMGSMAAGPTQLCVTAIAAHMLDLPGTLVFSLAAGIIVIELSAPARAATVRRILENEAILERRDD